MRRGASVLVIVVLLLAGTGSQAATPDATASDLTAGSSAGPPPDTPAGFSAETRRQMADAIAAKRARRGAAHKLSSALVARRESVMADARSLPADRTETARITVDITATVDAALDAALAAVGAEVTGRYPLFDSVRAEVPALRFDDVAALAQVRRVVPAQSPVHQGTGSIRSGVRLAAQGTVASEAETAHDVDDARTAFSVTGTGQKVCVVSDGLDDPTTGLNDLLVSQDALEVPGTIDVLPGQAGSGAEGLAMLELVHDLAPGAALGFATGFNGSASMATNIVALQAAGCTVIVDDLSYPLAATFQDDVIAQAVNQVTAAGAVYLSSAGNSGNLAATTSGTWEGDFRPGPSDEVGVLHDWDAGPALTVFNQVANHAGRVLTLTWPDPLGGATTDYDLYVVDAQGNLITGSDDLQSETRDPLEAVLMPSNAAAVVVALYAGPPTLLRLHLSRGLVQFATSGATFGHNAGLNAISVAAAPAAVAQGPGAPAGPAPGQPFTSANRVELFSSDGPRRQYFSPTGTPYTPGNFSSTGGIALAKPDIVAADGTATSVPGFARFYGTSAAAPHAAAIVALMRQHRPAATVAQLKAALRTGVIDIGNPGFDPDSGFGILMAPAALQALTDGAVGPAVPTPVEPDFVPLAPQRLLETRADVGQVGYSGPRPGAGQVIELQITGNGLPPVPADARAVALNITGTGVAANGFVTAYPCGAPRPTASNLNLTTNDTRANLVVSKIGDGGRVCLFTLNPTHLIADLAGYMPGGSPYQPVVPERLLETRPAGQTGYTGDKPAPGQTLELQVTGRGAAAVPADAAAVVLNVTATDATVAGFVTVYPCGDPRPTASNLNLTPGVTAANLVVSKLGAGGKVCLFTQWGGHLLADVAGYHPAGVRYTALNPVRLLDTRIGLGATGAPAAGRIVPLTVRGSAGVGAGATSVVLNVTATDVAADGFVTVWPCAEPRPTASNVNVPRNDTRPNLVYAKVDGNGQVCLFTQQPKALIADVVGWYP